jgi:hypothetical protein
MAYNFRLAGTWSRRRPRVPACSKSQVTHGRQLALTGTIPSAGETSVTEPELVFEKVKDHYFLARIVPEDGNSRELILTPKIMERESVHVTAHFE